MQRCGGAAIFIEVIKFNVSVLEVGEGSQCPATAFPIVTAPNHAIEFGAIGVASFDAIETGPRCVVITPTGGSRPIHIEAPGERRGIDSAIAGVDIDIATIYQISRAVRITAPDADSEVGRNPVIHSGGEAAGADVVTTRIVIFVLHFRPLPVASSKHTPAFVGTNFHDRAGVFVYNRFAIGPFAAAALSDGLRRGSQLAITHHARANV